MLQKMKDCINLLSYKGIITFDKINDLLDEFQLKMPAACSLICRSRLYSIAVECLENVYKHNSEESDAQVTVELWCRDSEYVLSVENKIKNDEIEPLAKYIDKINAASTAELKKLYNETIYNTGISEKGGARLGLMKIRRSTPQPISYKFVTIDETTSLFNITVRITDVNQSNLNVNECHQNTGDQNIPFGYF
jgi:hypothetical protein